MEPPNNEEELVWFGPPSSGGHRAFFFFPFFPLLLVVVAFCFLFSSLLVVAVCVCCLAIARAFAIAKGSESELPPWRWRPRAACCCCARPPPSPRSPSTSPAASQAAFEMSATRLALSKSPRTGRCFNFLDLHLSFQLPVIGNWCPAPFRLRSFELRPHSSHVAIDCFCHFLWESHHYCNVPLSLVWIPLWRVVFGYQFCSSVQPGEPPP